MVEIQKLGLNLQLLIYLEKPKILRPGIISAQEIRKYLKINLSRINQN